jgi:hypothetical protein
VPYNINPNLTAWCSRQAHALPHWDFHRRFHRVGRPFSWRTTVDTISSGLIQSEPVLVIDAWVFTISALEASTAERDSNCAERRATAAPRHARRRRRKLPGDDVPEHLQPHAIATFVERISERSILVNWCDATSCHYCDQLWTKRSARNAGYCALTGNLIARGDVIYGPYTRVAHPPANERAMILASSVRI